MYLNYLISLLALISKRKNNNSNDYFYVRLNGEEIEASRRDGIPGADAVTYVLEKETDTQRVANQARKREKKCNRFHGTSKMVI